MLSCSCNCLNRQTSSCVWFQKAKVGFLKPCEGRGPAYDYVVSNKNGIFFLGFRQCRRLLYLCIGKGSCVCSGILQLRSFGVLPSLAMLASLSKLHLMCVLLLLGKMISYAFGIENDCGYDCVFALLINLQQGPRC